VDNARRRREESRDAEDLGLEPTGLLARQQDEILNPIPCGRLADRIELRKLIRARRHKKLLAALMGDAVFGAEAVQERLPFDAEFGAQTAGGIVNTGVDDLAVAGACLRPDQAMLLEDKDFLAGDRKGTRNRQSDDPGANDNSLDIR